MEPVKRVTLALGMLLACLAFRSGAEAAKAEFVRGNTNADASLDIGDPITILEYLFLSKPIPCVASANTNGDLSMDIGDAVYLLNYLFIDGPPPSPPFPDCGPDPIVAVDFPCDSFPPCATARPDPPTGLTCTPGPGELDVSLAWTNGDAYDEVEIFRGAVSIAKIPVAASYKDTVPAPGTYAYTVVGRKGGQASTASAPCEATLTIVVAAVTDITCGAVSGTLNVDLSWQNPEAYAEIEIKRDGAQIYRGATIRTYRDAAAGPGPHTYEVIGYRLGVASAPASCAVTVRVPPPAGFTCEQQGNQLKVRLSWQNPVAYNQVEILRGGVSLGTFPPVSPYDDTVPRCGLYEYSVRGIVGAFASDPVARSVNVTLVPAAASDVACVQLGLDPQVRITWTNNGAYESIEILRNGAQVALLGLVATYTDTVPAQGAYTYSVVPHLCNNVAPPATCAVTVRTEVAPPANVRCAQRDNIFLVDLSWTNAAAYTKLEIYRNGAKVAEPAPAATNYADPVTACGTFNYEIRAYIGTHASLPSPCSAPVNVTPDAPANLACVQSAAALAVNLSWRNTTTYESIRILRNGSLVATLAGTATSHTDPVPAYGDYAYQVIGILCANPSTPASCAVHVGPPGPANLACQDVDQRQGVNPLQVRQIPAILLSWTNPQVFSAIRILRDGLSIVELPGVTQEYLDLVPVTGPHTYDVLGIAGGVQPAAARCTITSAARTTTPIWATLRFDVQRRLTAADPATNVWVRVGTPVLNNGWQLSIKWDPGLVFEHCEGALSGSPPYTLTGTCYEDGVDFEGFKPWVYYKQYRETSVTVGVIMDSSFQNVLPADPDRPIFRLRFRASPFAAGQVYRLTFEPTVTPNGAILDNNVTGRVPIPDPPGVRWTNLWPLYLYYGEIRAE